MEFDLFLKIVNELASSMQSPMLMLALHNEPLIDKRIFDWVKQVKSINPKCYCILPTNGELLDKFSLIEIMQSELNQLNINLNAHSKEIYGQINTGLDFDKVMKNIFHLQSDQFMRRKMQMMFVLNEVNSHEVQKAIEFWKQKEVRTKVVELSNRGGTLDTYANVMLKNLHYTKPLQLKLWKNLMSSIRGVIGCELPFYQMNVLFNGDVIICSNDWNRTTVVGNVKTSSLKSIWNSERMNEIRGLILKKKYEKIYSCRECSVVNRDAKLTKEDIN
jgi:radical SAM protein with 4Fe4S-binding SPASM domain